VVYERIVNPWVDQYESKVDDAVEEAHRGVRRWIWSRLGGVTWMLIGEGGSLAEGLLNVIVGFMGVDSVTSEKSRDGPTIQPSRSTESLPRHSVKEALSQSSSIEEVDEVGNLSFDPSDEFVNDFISMLEQGLYVFANVAITDEATGVIKERNQHVFEGGFKLGIFSYTKDEKGVFLISPMAAGADELDTKGFAPVRLPIDTLKPLRSNGSQGLILECHGTTSGNKESFTTHVRTEIVLSDESDREILMNGLNACLPYILLSREKSG